MNRISASPRTLSHLVGRKSRIHESCFRTDWNLRDASFISFISFTSASSPLLHSYTTFPLHNFVSLGFLKYCIFSNFYYKSLRSYSTQSKPMLDALKSSVDGFKSELPDLSEFTPDRIRNFSIIAHIDHGKSTLADRLLELTGTIVRDKEKPRVLDKLKVEKERGITVKAQTASMFYTHSDGKKYLLNLVDTPGHVDFSYEVSRSLAACQGTILLVDAVQGIQAQTVANFFLAFGEGLEIIPVLNKVDLFGADPDKVSSHIQSIFELSSDNILRISAKTGLNVAKVLSQVIEKVPPPSFTRDSPFKSLLFDTWYDQYVGVVCLVAVHDGIVKKGKHNVQIHNI